MAGGRRPPERECAHAVCLGLFLCKSRGCFRPHLVSSREGSEGTWPAAEAPRRVVETLPTGAISGRSACARAQALHRPPPAGQCLRPAPCPPEVLAHVPPRNPEGHRRSPSSSSLQHPPPAQESGPWVTARTSREAQQSAPGVGWALGTTGPEAGAPRWTDARTGTPGSRPRAPGPGLRPRSPFLRM